jgi:hypothetical protein
MNGGTRQTKLSRWHGAHTARSQATFELDPKHTALLTIDMQDEFVRPGWTAYWVPEATRIAVSNAADYAKFLRSYYAVIHIYDDAGNVIETHDYGIGVASIASYEVKQIDADYFATDGT